MGDVLENAILINYPSGVKGGFIEWRFNATVEMFRQHHQTIDDKGMTTGFMARIPLNQHVMLGGTLYNVCTFLDIMAHTK